MTEKKQLHFGVVISSLDDTCQYDIWTGIVEYAKKNNIRLTAYISTYQTNSYDFTPHHETCFEIIKNSDSLDGVIIFSGFITGSITYEEFERYVAKISDHLPPVSVSYVLPGIPSVLIDNTAGIYDATEHLIKVHNKKHIAFVKGPDGHFEAESRFTGYKNALKANGIVYDERYIFPGNFTHSGGELAVAGLSENSELSADAIVTCDDTTAIGVLRELKARNIMVPADIAVAGFDDDRDSATFIPSISTVRQDFCKIGSMSAQVLSNQINKIPVDDVTLMPPVFIKRQSCGCLETVFSDTEMKNKNDDMRNDSLESYISDCFMFFFIQDIPVSKIDEWIAKFVDVIKQKPFSKDYFLHFFNEILIAYSQNTKDILVWNEVLNALTIGVELYNDEVDCSYKILSTLILATALVQEVRFKEIKIRELAISDNKITLRRVAGNIVSIFDIDSMVDELQKMLPELSINTAVIGLYKHSVKNCDTGADRTADRFIGYDGNKKIDFKCSGADPALLSDYSVIEGFDYKKHSELLLFPLFFKDEEYGVILMPFDPEIPVDVYETLRVNISTAVKGAGLIKEVETALKQATEASKAKSDFLSAMSHEMRTPMNAIIGMTAIGKKSSELEEKNYTLNKIEDASSHLLGVISDVLDMAKIEAKKLVLSPVEFNFERMLQKVLTVINHRLEEKQQTLSINMDNEIPQIFIGDDQRLAQVITNLLSNAVKFTPEKGNIYLDISMIGEVDDYCELLVEVADTGIGISPEQQEKLFRAFEQAESGTSRKYGGTGLGLVISKNIVDLMNGKIWVESEPGKGAKFGFIVELLKGEESQSSLSDQDIQAKSDNENSKNDLLKGKTVLLAEDIEINREIFLALLENMGLIIECAENGKEAYEMVEASPDKYDIIFMDVQMPLMSGYEATRCIRALPALKDVDLPIIAMTANVFKSDIEECLAAGMNDHLGKPLDIDKILLVLHKYLQK